MLTPSSSANGRLWQRGDVATLRWVRNSPADLVAPVRIVEHDVSRTILYLAEGSPLKIRADAEGNRIGQMGSLVEREGRIRTLIDGIWTDNHALMIHEPHRLGSVWLFWLASDWSFNNYYINLQAPLEPSAVGFDTADYLLDVVVKPDLSWEWKDEDEFTEALKQELIPPVLLHAVRSEGRRFIRELEARQWPFGSDLNQWRPEPEWSVPSMPENWADGLTFPGRKS